MLLLLLNLSTNIIQFKKRYKNPFLNSIGMGAGDFECDISYADCIAIGDLFFFVFVCLFIFVSICEYCINTNTLLHIV